MIKLLKIQKQKICLYRGTSGFVTKFPTSYENSKLNYINTLFCRSWHNIQENDKMLYIWGHSHKFQSNLIKNQIDIFKNYLKDFMQNRRRFSAYDLSEDNLDKIEKEIFTKNYKTLLCYGSTLSIISKNLNYKISPIKKILI